MTEECVMVEMRGAVAWLTLNRPQAGNAIDLATARRLRAIAGDVAGDAAMRCVVLTGAGRLFCAGGDVPSFAAAGAGMPGLIAEVADTLHDAMLILADMEKPLVTLVNGPAAGAGLGLAAIGDIVLAAPAAHFTAAYGAVGLTPDGGATWLLPRLIGMRRAQEMLLTNRRIGAEEAAAIGLVTRVTADGALAAEGHALAEQLANGPTRAIGRTRRLLADGQDGDLRSQLAAEARGIAAASDMADGREGIAAFVGRRAPVFQGE